MSSLFATLTPSELFLAALTGCRRHVEAIEQRLRDRHGSNGDEGWTGWLKHIRGAAGEVAVAKARGKFWPGDVNTFKAPDLGPHLQVRTRSDPRYDLIVRDDDNPEHLYVLVIDMVPKFEVVGTLWGIDARREEWRHTHGGREAAWFVPRTALMPAERGESWARTDNRDRATTPTK